MKEISDAEFKSKQFELKKLEFEKTMDQRNFEIDNFWRRGWFFGALLLALAAAFFQSGDMVKQYQVYIAFLGLLVAISQSLMNRGSKYWQERWENRTKNRESALGIDVTKTRNQSRLEKHYLDVTNLAKNENGLVLSRRFSVSKLTVLVWDIIVLFFAFLWMKSCRFWPYPHGTVNKEVLVFHLVIVIYILLYFYLPRIASGNKNWRKSGGRVYQPFSRTTNQQGHSQGADSRYFDDSEKYVENDF